MNIIKRRITTMLIFPLIAVALWACEDLTPPVPGAIEMRQPVYAAAQSTLDYGQNQMDELSHQATVVSLNMDQAANAAAQTTMDYNQRQLMELSIRGTEISDNMARAAATQQFIAEQTHMAQDAASTAQSQAATATESAYIFNIKQTELSQAMLDLRAAKTSRAVAALTAIPRTITPLAQTQAAILFQQRKYERQSFWGEIVNPLKVILTTLVILLLIAGGILAFRRLMPVLEFRLRNPRGNISPLFLMDGMIVDVDSRHRRLTLREPRQAYLPQPPNDGAVQVEIISPYEPSVARWITEAEQELRRDGGQGI